MTKIITLGWNSSDQLAGSLRELSEQFPNSEPLKALYKALSSGSDEPVTIQFDDEQED